MAYIREVKKPDDVKKMRIGDLHWRFAKRV